MTDIIYDKKDQNAHFIGVLESLKKDRDYKLKHGVLYDYYEGVFLYYDKKLKKYDIRKDWYNEDLNNPDYKIIAGGYYGEINKVYQAIISMK